MSTLFWKDSRAIFFRLLLAGGVLGALVTAAVGYYVTPKWTRVGYRPDQPVGFSHKLHVGTVGLDCRVCHTHVGESAHANIPTAQVCMNCHDVSKGNIKGASANLAGLREAYAAGRPVEWVKVHKVPDYAYFNHAVHVKSGVGCVSCHGQVNEMEVVRHEQPLSMSWCLECHRDPGPSLRPAGEVTNLGWDGKSGWDSTRDPMYRSSSQEEFSKRVMERAGINPPTNCTGCHR